MSLGQILTGLKYAANSTIGTNEFKPLDQLIKEQTIDLSATADKKTLDSLVTNVGATADIGGGYQTGSISAKLNNVINSIGSINTNVNNIKTVTDTINANVNAVANKIPGGLQATLGAINTHAGDANTNAYNASIKADTIINTVNAIKNSNIINSGSAVRKVALIVHTVENNSTITQTSVNISGYGFIDKSKMIVIMNGMDIGGSANKTAPWISSISTSRIIIQVGSSFGKTLSLQIIEFN